MNTCIIDILVEESKDGFAVVLKANGHEIERTEPFASGVYARALADTLGERAAEMAKKIILEQR